MILEQESQLFEQIKSKKFFPIYLFYGEENYLKEYYCKKMQEYTVGDNFPEMNFCKFDGNKLKMEDLVLAVESMPFLAEQRCVIVSDFPYSTINSQDMEIFSSILEAPVPTTTLILVVNDPDFNPKKNAKAKKLVAQIDHIGVVVELKKRAEADIVKFIQKKVKENDCSISKELCRYVIERCENDMLLIENEINKVTAYAKSGEITKKHIDDVTIKAISARIYDLAKAILSERCQAAMDILQDLLYLKYQPTVILSALWSAYLDLYIAKCANSAGKNADDITKNFEYRGREFVVKNSLRDSYKYSIEVLRNSIMYLSDCDKKMKSSRADNNIILEQCVVQLSLIGRK